MKNYIFSLLLCCSSITALPVMGADPVKPLIEDFLSTDWPKVMAAKEKIENLGITGIPEILTVMNNCDIYKLENTGDLIYPGAEKFFGHGQIIDYDIDVACVRAGWLLEELTFKNFGFSGIHLHATELLDFMQKTFPEYYNNPDNQKQIELLNEEGKRVKIRELSIERAKSWWATSSRQWNRLSALEQSLNSKDEKCQVKGLFYLRNGRTSCKGLTQKFYKSRLSKAIEKLSKSETGRVSENAKLIMLDSDFSWLSLKPVK